MSRHLIMPVMGLCFCVTSSFADIQIFNGPKNPVLSAEKKEFQKEVEKQFERWVQVKATHYKKIEFQKFAKRFLGAKTRRRGFKFSQTSFIGI